MRRLTAALLAITIGGLAAVMPTAPFSALVLAHCTTISGNFYAYANESGFAQSDGVMGNIDWTQGNICTSGVSHSVTLCKASNDCGHWVQVGWRYSLGYAEPMMYCEFSYPGHAPKQVEFAITHATHHYKMQVTTQGFIELWTCYKDGGQKYVWPVGSAGFSSGTYVDAQGEAHQDHVQIGLMAPNRLSFFNLQRRTAADSSWHFITTHLGLED